MKAYKNRYLTGSLTALLSCLLLFSCSEDKLFDRGCSPAGEYSDHISFGVSPDTGVQTRGAAGMGSGKGEVAGNFVLRAADAPDTLCMQAVITDGINPSSEPQVVTRSTPIDSKDNFYNSFHVVAYWKKGDVPVTEQFYMDADVSEQVNNRWTTDNTYYWPGNGHTLQFYALTPDDAGIRMPATPASTHLSSYTVPQDVAEQHDILVATTEELSGNYNQAVPLTFEHICTAIKFETGSQMQPGSIRSVTLKGVKTTGAYDMFSGKWTLTKDVGNYTQELAKTMTGTETPGSEVTTAAQTFMMLPQTLPQGATVEVVFVDDVTGNERPLSATIDGTEWPQGKTVTYKISISPEYEFKLSEERILDAHYEIYQTTLSVSGVPEGTQWTISSPDDVAVTIQAQSDMNSWAKQGYWTDRMMRANSSGSTTDNGSARGNASYSGTGSGEFPIAIFVPENVGENKRTLALEVTMNSSAVQTINIDQYAPSWYGNGIGCERIEGRPQPWGFYWSGDYALTFDLKSCNEDDRTSLRRYVEWTQGLHDAAEDPLIGWLVRLIFGDNIPDLSFITMEKSGDFIGIGGRADKITINLGTLTADNIAESTDNGQHNTREIYNYEGIQLVNEIINHIQNNIRGYNSNMMTETGTGTFPDNNAAIACMKLNSWNVVVTPEIPGVSESEEMLQLSNNSPIPDWYLPASAEVSGIKDEVNALNGDYWTSTSVANSHENAYKYDTGGNVSQERRDIEHNVRAVRKKP